MPSAFDLTSSERQLLDAAEDDYIDIHFALMYLGIRTFEGAGSPRATSEEIESGFRTLTRLHDLGLIEVGKLEYDDGGPAGRLTSVHHVSEPLDTVKDRVLKDASNVQDPTAWYFAAWITLTEAASRAT